MGKWQVGNWGWGDLGVGRFGGGGVCCSSLLKSNVKIFDIYTEESEYIQAAKTAEDDFSPSTRYVWHC